MSEDKPRSDARTRVLAGLILGLFLAALEGTVVATAMPSVIRELGGQRYYGLPFAIYMLLATVSGPLWGYAADQRGKRSLYLVSVALFVAGSMACGAAPSMPALVAARALQGLGAGGVQTLTFTIIGELYPMEQRAKVQGYISGVWGVSALIGPLAGGLIVDKLSWRWVFYVNVPFGAPAAWLVGRGFRDARSPSAGRMDWAGAALFTAGAALLVVGLQDHRLVLALAGAALLAVFPVLERRHPAPLLPLDTLRDGLLARAVLGNLLGGAAFFGITTYLPLYLQQTRGQSATVAGAVLSPAIVGWTSASIVAARLLPRIGPRPLARIGSAAVVLGCLLWTVTLRASPVVLGAAGLVCGFGMGSAMLSLFVSAQERAPRAVLGRVTAALLFARNIGGSLGAAAGGALLGTALDRGGVALGAVFWRVPVGAAVLALGLLLAVGALPDIAPRPGPGPKDAPGPDAHG